MTSSVHHLKEKTFRHITSHFYKLVKIMINIQRKRITTFLTYERHVENFISSNSWSMPPPAPGPVWRLELSMLESGERLLLSGLLASVSRSLLRSLSRRRRFLSPSRSLSPPSSGTMGVAATNRVKQNSREY